MVAFDVDQGVDCYADPFQNLKQTNPFDDKATGFSRLASRFIVTKRLDEPTLIRWMSSSSSLKLEHHCLRKLRCIS